jgi:hypothetical protein
MQTPSSPVLRLNELDDTGEAAITQLLDTARHAWKSGVPLCLGQWRAQFFENRPQDCPLMVHACFLKSCSVNERRSIKLLTGSFTSLITPGRPMDQVERETLESEARAHMRAFLDEYRAIAGVRCFSVPDILQGNSTDRSLHEIWAVNVLGCECRCRDSILSS